MFVYESIFGSVAVRLPFFALFALSAIMYAYGFFFNTSNTLRYVDVAYSATVSDIACRLGQMLMIFARGTCSPMAQQKAEMINGIVDCKISCDALGIIARAFPRKVLLAGVGL